MYRIRFADLAIVHAELEPSVIDGETQPRFAGDEFSIMVAIDNLGDLPARDAGAQLRIYISHGPRFAPPGRELAASYWQLSAVVFLNDGIAPNGYSLNSLQSGFFIARRLISPNEPGLYSVLVCIEFPDGPPFGDKEGNNCSDGINLNLQAPD